jgi:trk system potassium uptake protein TrkH
MGWLGLYIGETQFGGVLQDVPIGERLVTTWFQSVSTRTAGFPGLDNFNELLPASQLLVMGLMFIGSAPASMGGGITTGTFVVLLVAFISYVRGNRRARTSRRTIPIGTVRRAAAILSLSLIVVLVATWLLLMTNEVAFGPALFEIVSAFATCGLSLGITGSLNGFGLLLIMFMMFWGRLGALTLVVALIQRQSPEQLLDYPEEPVLIG